MLRLGACVNLRRGAVREAMAQGKLTGNGRLSAKAIVTLDRIGLSHKVDGEIELG